MVAEMSVACRTRSGTPDTRAADQARAAMTSADRTHRCGCQTQRGE
jgi:hypothetical protein